MTAACGDAANPTAPSSAPAPGNTDRTPPVITALTLSEAGTIEVDRDILVRADVTDSDTAVENLLFVWSANVGVITGTGRNATWRLKQGTATPVDVTISLAVIESYQITGAGGRVEAREFRVSRDAPAVRVHDSVSELSDMALSYLATRYGTTLDSPAQCLANFSDRCQGKADELAEITEHRRLYENLLSEAWLGKVTVDRPKGQAEVVAPCTFTSREIATGKVNTTSGNCVLTAIYEQRRWWLCSSTLTEARTSAAIVTSRRDE